MTKPYNSNRCRRKRQVKAGYSCSRPCKGVPTGGSSNRLFCFPGIRQGASANGPMSGLHPYTDGISVVPPMPVAFRSDHENEQHKPTSAFGPRYGCSIKGIRRSASSSPLGWLKTPKPHRSGVSGARHCPVDLTKAKRHNLGTKPKR